MSLKAYVFVLCLATTPAVAFDYDDIFQTRMTSPSRPDRGRDERGPWLRPVMRTKSAMIAFKTSPFPYRGLVPHVGKPFLDVDENGKRGHTSPRGNVLWENETYNDRRVLVHVPRGFDPNAPAALIVYFHGNLARLGRDVLERQQVPQQIAESGINAVLIAPQFAVDAQDSSAGRFWEPGVFAQFLDEASDHLAKFQGQPASRKVFRSMPVVLVAYSGGYFPAAYSAAVGGVSNRLIGVVLFDALYAEHGKFAEWILRRKDGFFVSAYGPSTKNSNEIMQAMLTEKGVPFQKSMPLRVSPGTVTFISAGTDVEHNDFVTNAWVARPLKELLQRIPSLRRGAKGPEKPKRERY